MKNEFVNEKEHEGFIRGLIERLRSKMSKDITFDYQRIIKTNDVPVNALVVRRESSPIGKMIYTDELYEDHTQGREIEEIADFIVDNCNEKEPFEEDVYGDMLLNRMKDWSYLMDDHITLKLVNRKMNSKYLEGKTVLPFLDLAIVFCMVIEEFGGGIATTMIPVEASKSWGINLEEAFEQVIQIMPRRFPVVRRGINEFLFKLKEKSGNETDYYPFLDMEDDKQLFVQTVVGNFNGSITVLYKGCLDEFCTELNTEEMYILPSSIHEVLFLKKDNCCSSGSELSCIVRAVNRDQVESTEVLSDNVYVYSNKTKQISIFED